MFFPDVSSVQVNLTCRAGPDIIISISLSNGARDPGTCRNNNLATFGKILVQIVKKKEIFIVWEGFLCCGKSLVLKRTIWNLRVLFCTTRLRLLVPMFEMASVFDRDGAR